MSVDCGLAGKSAKHRCDRRAKAALRRGRAQPAYLNFAQHLNPNDAVGELERLLDLASLMHTHPDYRTPKAVARAMRTVIASGKYAVLRQRMVVVAVWPGGWAIGPISAPGTASWSMREGQATCS